MVNYCGIFFFDTEMLPLREAVVQKKVKALFMSSPLPLAFALPLPLPIKERNFFVFVFVLFFKLKSIYCTYILT